MGTGIGSKFRGALLGIWYAQAPAFRSRLTGVFMSCLVNDQASPFAPAIADSTP